MKIQSVNTNFGKRLIARCDVKNKEKQKHEAFLYEYDPWNSDDVKEIENSSCTGAIGYDFYKAGLWHNYSKSKFYAIQDNETKDIVATCELSHHINPNHSKMCDYLEIQELEGNEKYIDSLTPMLAHIANLGKFHNSDSVISSCYVVDEAKLQKHKFNRLGMGIWSLPAKRFEENITKGEKRNSLNYVNYIA